MGALSTVKTLPQGCESFRKLNPSLYGGPQKAGLEPRSDSDGVGATHRPQKRIRQSQKPLMNKLEQEWFDHLVSTFPKLWFCPQTTKFKLGNGIWYKPDITCPYFNGIFTCWEVKGPFAHRGGFENLKVAASKYPEFKWILVWKENGQWKEQTVLP